MQWPPPNSRLSHTQWQVMPQEVRAKRRCRCGEIGSSLLIRMWRSVGVFFVGFDDHLDELVADDVFIGEVDEFDRVDVLEDMLGFFEAALLAAGQVDLRLVAGDDRLRAKPD